MVKRRQKITAYHEEPVYYSLTEPELEQLKEKAKIPEKENAFFLVGLFIPALINLLTSHSSADQATSWVFNLNLIIVVITFILALFQIKGWVSKASGYGDLINSLKEKPQIELQVSGNAAKYVKDTQE